VITINYQRIILVDGRVQVSDNDRFRVIADRVWFGSEPTAGIHQEEGETSAKDPSRGYSTPFTVYQEDKGRR
jgi:hypothetical protein